MRVYTTYAGRFDARGGGGDGGPAGVKADGSSHLDNMARSGGGGTDTSAASGGRDGIVRTRGRAGNVGMVLGRWRAHVRMAQCGGNADGSGNDDDKPRDGCGMHNIVASGGRVGIIGTRGHCANMVVASGVWCFNICAA